MSWSCEEEYFVYKKQPKLMKNYKMLADKNYRALLPFKFFLNLTKFIQYTFISE